MIIGVTGKMGAGKDTFARYLAQKGFAHISLSDFIRDEAKKRKLPPNRRNLQDIGCQMRQINGAGVFSKMALAKIGKVEEAVITSIRNPGEIKVLARAKTFVLINVTAPREIRFARILSRMVPSGEKITFAEFCRAEAREAASTDSAAQQLEKCAAMADFSIANGGDLPAFYHQIDQCLASLDFSSRDLNLAQNCDTIND